MSDFLNRMKSAAKADLKTIVLPEGEDPRTIVAATKIIEEGLAKIVILGNPDEIDVPGATVIDPRNAEKHEEYAQKFAELRAKKGVTIEQARAQVMDATYFGTMMVKMGDADGLVSGACHSTADTLRPALQILKTAPGTKLVSAFFVMCTDTPQFGTDGTLIFAVASTSTRPPMSSPRSPSPPLTLGPPSWAMWSRTWPCSPTPPWAPPVARSPRRSRRP